MARQAKRAARRQTIEEFLAQGGRVTVCEPRRAGSGVLDRVPDRQPWKGGNQRGPGKVIRKRRPEVARAARVNAALDREMARRIERED